MTTRPVKSASANAGASRPSKTQIASTVAFPFGLTAGKGQRPRARAQIETLWCRVARGLRRDDAD